MRTPVVDAKLVVASGATRDVNIGGLCKFAKIVLRGMKRQCSQIFRLKCWVANQVCATIRMTDLLRDPVLVEKHDEKKIAELAVQHAVRVHRRVFENVLRFQQRAAKLWVANANGWDIAFVAGKRFVRAYIHPDVHGKLFNTAVQGGYIVYIDERGRCSFIDPVGTTTPMWSMDVANMTMKRNENPIEYAIEYAIEHAACTDWEDTSLGMFSDLNRLLEFV